MECSEMRMCEFIESRAVELENLLDRIQVISSNSQVFQRLPKHIRRRAMSHNKKRLPRKLRDEALSNKESNTQTDAKNQSKPTTKKSNMPNRKQRRRPAQLLAEFTKRQRRIRWLPTHIWHAKRFFMVEKWGFRVAHKTTERTFRANYRAQSAHRLGCQLIDVSYLRCIQISCPNRELLIRGLKRLIPDPVAQSTGLLTDSVLRGRRMCEAMLYHAERYPYGAICRTEIVWKPSEQPAGTNTSAMSDSPFAEHQAEAVWIWLHPDCLDEALNAIRQVFTIERARADSECEAQAEAVCAAHVLNQVEVRDVSDQLARFRLMGNRSGYVLRSVLELSDDDLSTRGACEQSRDFVLAAIDLHKSAAGAQVEARPGYFKLKKLARQLCELKAQRCDKLNSVQATDVDQQLDAALLDQSCDAAFTFNVRDPRLVRARQESSDDAERLQLSDDCVNVSVRRSFSIWQHAENTENVLRIEPLKNGTLSSFRSVLGDAAMRGSVVDAQVPVLLVRHTGYAQLAGAYSRDWVSVAPELSIVVPVEFARTFWTSLVHANVRVGGLRDFVYSELLRGRLAYLDAFPDSAGGRREEAATCDAVRKCELRRPPAKRRRFGEDGNFVWWKLLLGAPRDLQGKHDLFYVLRDRCILLQLDALLHDENRSSSDDECNQLIMKHRRALVAVSVRFLRLRRTECNTRYSLAPIGRGIPKRFDLLCLPVADDFGVRDMNNDETITTGLVSLGQGGERIVGVERTLIGQVKSGDFLQNRGTAVGFGYCSLTGFAAAARVSAQIRENTDATTVGILPQVRQTVALLRNPNLHHNEFRFVRLQLNYAEAF